MTFRQLKAGYFVLEGLNSCATSFYFYYLFFFMEREFGFGNRENLALAALNGLVYIGMARIGGRYGQRHGYFKALRVGFITLIIGLVAGGFAQSSIGALLAMVIWTMGVCFTWPMLEALASEKEDSLGLQQMIGIYNVVWAGTSALAYFAGGTIIEKLGIRSFYWIPAGIHLVQLALLAWIERKAAVVVAPAGREVHGTIQLNPRPIARAKSFLRMAWWANPFAYVAINTVAAVVPSVARKMDLSPAMAGFVCSIWFFARFGTFLALWRWNGWQYRLRWFLGAFCLLIFSFAFLLLVPRLAVLLIAQVAFGLAVGLIYYSSLYYSMDVGEAKSEHGGLHESAIGMGLFAGPALGATTLYLHPDSPNSGTVAVSVALCCGLIGLLIQAFPRKAVRLD